MCGVSWANPVDWPSHHYQKRQSRSNEKSGHKRTLALGFVSKPDRPRPPLQRESGLKVPLRGQISAVLRQSLLVLFLLHLGFGKDFLLDVRRHGVVMAEFHGVTPLPSRHAG
jgi:hypothetical protein